jgi:heavy metal translocating P-type ATPase
VVGPDVEMLPRRAAASILLAVSVVAIALGGALSLLDVHTAAAVVWSVATIVGFVFASWWTFEALRRGRPGVDLIAALALVGTIAIGEYLAGAVVAAMLATGRVIEARASRRAERELTALLSRAPREAHLLVDGRVELRPVEDVRPADLVLVEPGEVVPVDGRVEGGEALLDESALTGEANPVRRARGEVVRSGVVNASGAFQLRATNSAADSTYAGILRLVEAAGAEEAPFVRLADRYALVFLAFTAVVATVAAVVARDPVRAVAVLVVATPCPLILAAPVAIVSGMGRCARRGVLVKDGAALERLGGATVLLFDKTGTITQGAPAVTDVVVAPGSTWTAEEMVRFAGSVEQMSPHVLASAIVDEARRRDLVLDLPSGAEEVPGRGARGIVAGHVVTVGRDEWVAEDSADPWARGVRRHAGLDGAITIFVAVDGTHAGAFLLSDAIRADASRTVRALRHAGIRRLVMLTGDRSSTAEIVAAAVGVDEVLADRSPDEKVEAVRSARRSGTTVMVGDGVNDAPALAIADVGVAMGARGSTASSESADAVLMVDRLDRLAEAFVIARRAVHVARQSALVGIALSAIAMGFAAVGWLPPLAGALVQEAIDVVVILNALRVAVFEPPRVHLTGQTEVLGTRVQADHIRLRAGLESIRDAADALGASADALDRVREVHRFLSEEVVPHEEAEDAELYPLLDKAFGSSETTGTMSRAHSEIVHQVRRLGRLIDDVAPEGPDPVDVLELRRVLYGLDAILRLHFAQEDEGYFSLLELPEAAAGARP